MEERNASPGPLRRSSLHDCIDHVLVLQSSGPRMKKTRCGKTGCVGVGSDISVALAAYPLWQTTMYDDDQGHEQPFYWEYIESFSLFRKESDAVSHSRVQSYRVQSIQVVYYCNTQLQGSNIILRHRQTLSYRVHSHTQSTEYQLKFQSTT